MKITTITHIDVRGNEQKYLKIQQEVGDNSHLINVGNKTFEAINALLKQEEQLIDKLLNNDGKGDKNQTTLDFQGSED